MLVVILGKVQCMRTAIFVVIALLLAVAPTKAQQTPGDAKESDKRPLALCIYADRTYSPGAYLCVAEGTQITCNLDGKSWSTAQTTPTCKGPNTGK